MSIYPTGQGIIFHIESVIKVSDNINNSVVMGAGNFVFNELPTVRTAASAEPVVISSDKHYINVPYSEKDEAKALGALFDWSVKRWYFTDENDAPKFAKWGAMKAKTERPPLSDEQQLFIDTAKQGKNVLVDACIGSGKTMSIQALCDELPNKQILYLTYNMLLKIDAKEKIHNPNTVVTNYHGYAYSILKNIGISCNKGELIQTFLANKDDLPIPHYDLLILDEYQDIDLEISQMLECIKDNNPDMQIVAVGDMEQKIYDKTSLDVSRFIHGFLDDYDKIDFTKCFRISSSLARRLGKIWHKTINGVNKNCKVSRMPINLVVDYLADQKPEDILCLGTRKGMMSKVLNTLETKYPDKFNKNTVYASVSDEDRENVRPGAEHAIFTTYDASKGMERKICVVFDCTESYWESRINKPNTKYEVLRNIFCVAMSRGKEHIIFVKDYDSDDDWLSDNTLMTPTKEVLDYARPFEVSKMFEFKYKEDIENVYNLLNISEIKQDDYSEINVVPYDGLIDLSSCVGNLQEAAFFKDYDIRDAIEYAVEHTENSFSLRSPGREASLEENILYLTAIETDHKRYMKQVRVPFVDDDTLDKICKRLGSIFDGKETIQQDSRATFIINRANAVKIDGRFDAVKDDIIYELKFVSELSHEHFLQCAMYVIMFGLEKGRLWNIRNNKLYEIKIDDKNNFLKSILKTITKGCVNPKTCKCSTKPDINNDYASRYSVTT